MTVLGRKIWTKAQIDAANAILTAAEELAVAARRVLPELRKTDPGKASILAGALSNFDGAARRLV